MLNAYLDALPADQDIVPAAHSNAGLFVPLIAAAHPVAGYVVVVDAGLPPTSDSPWPHLIYRHFLPRRPTGKAFCRRGQSGGTHRIATNFPQQYSPSAS